VTSSTGRAGEFAKPWLTGYLASHGRETNLIWV
jgi:hypothetical protein